MNNRPFFSVVIPTYNRPDRVIRAIQSVLNQTMQDFEVIIVNDGSTADYTEVETFCRKDARIRYLTQENRYLAGARNTGIDKSTGDFICFLDDDDVYLPNHLSALQDLILQHHRQDALYHTQTLIEDFHGKRYPLPSNQNLSSNLDKVLVDRFPTNAVAISRVIAEKYKFNENLKYAEDLDLWINISQHFPIFKSKEYSTLLKEETLEKMSDLKLPNQANYFYAMLHIKKKYKSYVAGHRFGNKLSELALRCAELYKERGERLISLKFLAFAISYKFTLVFSRHYWSILMRP